MGSAVSPAFVPGRTLRFALVGVAATAIYAVLAWAGTEGLGLPSPLASIAAYAFAALCSYVGHRSMTFTSDRRHREAVPLFGGIAVFGYVVALGAPWLLTEKLGAPAHAAILTTCMLVPVFNYLALARVFAAAPARPGHA
jgi:putative flippase GtrA